MKTNHRIWYSWAFLLSLVCKGAVIAQTPIAVSIDVTDCVVRFADEVEVPSLESGRVAEVTAKLNAPVREGQSIARLDDRSITIRRRASMLRLDHARQIAIDDVELRYAETALAEAKAELDSNRSIYNDVSGAVPLTHIRRLNLAVERGELEVAQAQNRRNSANVEVQLREADLAMLDDQLDNLQIVSPLSGTVVEITRSVGEWIESGQTIATVARMDRLHVHALLEQEHLAPSLCENFPVSVHWIDPIDGQEKVLRGSVQSVDPQMLPGGRYRLHAEIINRQLSTDPLRWVLLPGTNVRMKVYVNEAVVKSARAKQASHPY